MSLAIPVSPVFDRLFFQAARQPRRFHPRRGAPPPRVLEKPADHPVLFLGGFLFAISLAVIGLWQAMGLLLPF